MLMFPLLLSRGNPSVPVLVATGSQDLGPFQAQSDGLALKQVVPSHAMPSGDVRCSSPLKLLAAICSGTGTPSLSEVSSKDYVNPFSGDKSNSWKILLHLLRNNNTFHTFGSVFIGHPSWHQTPLCP